MNIALDYDGTYTADPAMWEAFINVARMSGHEVRIVTARDVKLDANADLDRLSKEVGVIFTSGIAKRFVCEHFIGWVPDIWIDDNPASVANNSVMTPAQLAQWRATRTE